MGSAQSQFLPILLDIHRHQVGVLRREKEQLFPIRPPARDLPAARRNLILARAVGKAGDVDLGLSGLAGRIRYPFAIGRERRIGFIELRLHERGRLAISEKWQNPDFSSGAYAAFPSQVCQIPPIVTDGARNFEEAVSFQQLSGFFPLRALR